MNGVGFATAVIGRMRDEMRTWLQYASRMQVCIVDLDKIRRKIAQ